MKVGDLVRSKRVTHLGLGLITSVMGRYAWVAFQNWMENDKWCALESLEVISESR